MIRLCRSICQEDRVLKKLDEIKYWMSSTSEILTPQVELLRICRRVTEGQLASDAAYNIIRTLMKTNDNIPSLLVDVLAIVDLELNAEKKNEENRKYFLEFISHLTDRIVADDVLKCELDILGANEQTTRSRVVKTKTRLFFKQVKFNLLREESEGYAKLVTELLDNPSLTVSKALSRLYHLIGQFNLDPNRVIDIILECFESALQRRKFFIDLLTEFKASGDDICSILGFKFTFYQIYIYSEFQRSGSTPASLYRVAAALCDERVIDLLSLCTFLSPKLEDLMNDHKSRVERDGKRAKKSEIISTGVVSADPRVSSASAAGYVDDNATIAGVSFASVLSMQNADDAKLNDEKDNDDAVLAKNQKLGLTFALLEGGAWQFAKQMLDRFPEFYAVNASRSIALSIADLLERSTDDFYQEKSRFALGDTGTFNLGSSLAQTHSLEIVGSWSELISVVLPVLAYLGPHIAYRPKAAVKLVRLMALFFEEREKDPTWAQTAHTDSVCNALIDAIDETLVPALSLANGNFAYSQELWKLLSHLSYTVRYRTYARWKTVHTMRHPQINICRGSTFGMTRYVLKRLSKETVRMMGRQLGKLCHVHPAVVFDYILDQIQAFENLIEPVVESIRFLSDLEFDVLSFCIIEHLAAPDKQQLKASDGSLSPWLQSLATFVGNVFLKYNIELTGVLQYVANQLKNNKSFDLLVLREIIQNMSGIESTTGLTADQLEALAGGDTLRQEAGSFSTVRTNRRAILRLRDALFKEHLIVGLSILTAQQRQCIVYSESPDIPLKLAGQMLDQCQETLIQFGSFLRTNVRQEEYCNRMPFVWELIGRFHLPVDAAFFISRPTFMHRVYSNFDKSRKSLRESDGSKMKLDSSRKSALFRNAFDEMIGELESNLRPLLPDFIWTDISSKIFTIFWVLSMYDISVPKTTYERELQRVRKSLALVAENAEISKTKRAKEEEQLRSVEKKLTDELKKQSDHVERILNILRHDKELLFADCSPKLRGTQMARFLQHCILPRAVFTDMDAAFCAHFILLLHQQRTGFFQTVFFFDKLFNDIGAILATLTENEANCLGRFLALVLETVQRWHGDKAVFDKECYRFPGFMTKLHMRNPEVTNTDNVSDGMNYESYRTLCHKWQYRMTRSCLGILDGSNYVMMRNCLIVMIKVLAYFPLIENHIANIEKTVNKVHDMEKGRRDDLSLMAASYAGHLRMRKTHTYTESQFHNRLTDIAKKTTRAGAARNANGTTNIRTATKSSAVEITELSKQKNLTEGNSTEPRRSTNGAAEQRKAPVAGDEKRKPSEPSAAELIAKKKLKVSDGEDRPQLQAQRGNEEPQLRRNEIKKEGHREKEELKMEEGEVGSPPPNSHSEILPSHRKTRSSKGVEDEAPRREKERTRAEEKRERKRESVTSTLTRGKVKTPEDHLKTRERGWKRPAEPTDSDGNIKVARNEGSSGSDRSAESKNTKSSETSPSTRTTRHRRDPHRT
uniref:THO complex subunit 2 n=1 Tax=Elaeophora elaphi TaxID=1147741 RepID=A0A0R3RSG9_9BILA